MIFRNAGFTLIELMTSVAIVGILAGVGAPSLQAFSDHQRSASVMSALHAQMALARMTAISHGHRAILCPSIDGQHCSDGTNWSQGWMTFSDDNGNRSPDANEPILQTDLRPDNRRLRIVSNAGRQQLRYLPDGRSAGSNLTISICNMKNQLLGQIIVNNAGRPRSERPKQPRPCPA